VIAVSAATSAIGVFAYNGGTLTNAAGGSILAEAGTSFATACEMRGFSGDAIVNHGLIEAQTASADYTGTAIAIHQAPAPGSITTIDNYGVIRAPTTPSMPTRRGISRRTSVAARQSTTMLAVRSSAQSGWTG